MTEPHLLFPSKKLVYFEDLYQHLVSKFGLKHYTRALLREELERLKEAGKVIEITPNYFIPLKCRRAPLQSRQHRRTHDLTLLS